MLRQFVLCILVALGLTACATVAVTPTPVSLPSLPELEIQVMVEDGTPASYMSLTLATPGDSGIGYCLANAQGRCIVRSCSLEGVEPFTVTVTLSEYEQSSRVAEVTRSAAGDSPFQPVVYHVPTAKEPTSELCQLYNEALQERSQP